MKVGWIIFVRISMLFVFLALIAAAVFFTGSGTPMFALFLLYWFTDTVDQLAPLPKVDIK
jgi:hypothetical protein